MFIYMANIGTILASSFKYTYSKLCRYSLCRLPLFILDDVFIDVRTSYQTFPKKQLYHYQEKMYSVVVRNNCQAGDR